MINKLLIIFFGSMIPIGELRTTIPLGVLVYHLNWFVVLAVSIIGCIIPAIFFVYFLEPISQFLIKHSKFFKGFFELLFRHTRDKHQEKFNKLKELSIVLVSAIPLPLFGAWSGALFAFVFGIPQKKSIPLIAIGVTIMGFLTFFLSIAAKDLISLI